MRRRTALAVMCVPLIWSIVLGANIWGQDRDQDSGESKLRGRLPAYFSSLVNDEQKKRIYAIQTGYHTKIRALQTQIMEMESQRDKEVDSVLTPAQLEEVTKKREEAEKRREERRRERTLEKESESGRSAAN